MKKLLSIILVLAMLLGMTAMPVFAVGETPETPAAPVISSTYTKVAVGKSITVTKTSPTTVPTGYTGAWVSSDETVATVNNGTVEGVKAGTANISYVLTNSTNTTQKINSSAISVTVVDVSKYDLKTVSNQSTSVGVNKNLSVSVDLYNDTTKLSSIPADLTLTAKAASTDDAKIISVSGGSNGTATVTGLKNGEATITFSLSIGGYEIDSESYKITVNGIELVSEIENGKELDAYDYNDELLEFVLDEINDKFDLDLDDDDVSSLYIKKGSASSCGQLYIDQHDTASYEVANTTNLATAGVTFVAKAGAIGKNEYTVELTTKSSATEAPSTTFYGTWTINVTAYDEIEEEDDALFALEPYEVSLPSGIKYIKVVDDADSYEGVYTSSSTGMSSKLRFDPSSTKYEKKGNNAILYVVGLDSDGVAYTGTITLNAATYDIKYVGEKDEEIQMVKKDFEGILEDIFDENYTGTSTDYVVLDTVTFPGSSSKNYEVYNGTKKLSSSTKVDEDDISDVSVKPLKSAEHFLTVTLTGTVYDKNDKAKDKSYSKKAVVLISAVAGDVKYTVVGNSAVYLDADDFQDFYEDAKNSSSAVLSYITIDPADLKSTDGVFYVTKTAKLEDDDKLWADEDDTTTRAPYTIDEVRFVAGKSLANGTKIYIPFTASGKKGAENGYIEIEVINNPFTDVKSTDYFYDSALWAVGKGITKGTNAAGTLFSPAQGCTRAQVVTFLYRAAGSPSITSSMRAEAAKFTDVNSTKHKDFIDAIAWAKYYGITSGTSATTFGPDKTCTRAQIVTFIANYVNKVEGKSVTPIYSNQFTDVKPTTTHKSYAAAIQWAVEKGITKGTNAAGTLFSPDATCTRGQVVTFLYNYFK